MCSLVEHSILWVIPKATHLHLKTRNGTAPWLTVNVSELCILISVECSNVGLNIFYSEERD